MPEKGLAYWVMLQAGELLYCKHYLILWLFFFGMEFSQQPPSVQPKPKHC
jgi:hypothetical protein